MNNLRNDNLERWRKTIKRVCEDYNCKKPIFIEGKGVFIYAPKELRNEKLDFAKIDALKKEVKKMTSYPILKQAILDDIEKNPKEYMKYVTKSYPIVEILTDWL